MDALVCVCVINIGSSWIEHNTLVDNTLEHRSRVMITWVITG